MALKELYARSGGGASNSAGKEKFNGTVWSVEGEGIWMVPEAAYIYHVSKK